MTLTLSSPFDPGGPNATTGSFTFLRLLSPMPLNDGVSIDRSTLPAVRYNIVSSPTQFDGYTNSVTKKKTENPSPIVLVATHIVATKSPIFCDDI